MNLPNKLTILRMIMIVPFVVVMLAGAVIPAGIASPINITITKGTIIIILSMVNLFGKFIRQFLLSNRIHTNR